METQPGPRQPAHGPWGRGGGAAGNGHTHEPSLALHIEDLTVSYGYRPVLWDIDLDIPPGVLGAVVGPNGAGKSTLIKAVLGMVPIAAGHIYVFGRPHREQLHRIGYVPQRTSVDWDFPTTALDVVTMGLYGQLGWNPAARAPGAAKGVGSPGTSGHGGLRRPPNQPAVRRPAAAGVPGPGPGAGRGPVPDGRAHGRRGRHHRAAHHRAAQRLAHPGQDGAGGAPRPADGAPVL